MDEPRRAQRRPFPKRADLPEELHPLFDALTFELQRVHDYSHSVARLRLWLWVALGGCIGAALANLVSIWGRAIG